MLLARIDWVIVFSFFTLSLVIGIYSSKKAGKSATEFFFPIVICPGGYWVFRW